MYTNNWNQLFLFGAIGILGILVYIVMNIYGRRSTNNKKNHDVNLKNRYKLIKITGLSENNYRLAKVILFTIALVISSIYVYNSRYELVPQWYSVVDKWTGDIKRVNVEKLSGN